LVIEKRTAEDGRPLQGAVRRFRDPHHRVARLFASGLGLAEVAARSGYSYNRVSQLHADPAFQELIATYRRKVTERFEETIDEVVQEGLEQIRIGQRMVREQLEEAEENETHIPLRNLIALNADNMDRFGYGKRQTNLNVNADFASLLEKAITRSGKTIEGTALPPVVSPPQSPPSRAPPSSEGPPLADVPLRRRALT